MARSWYACICLNSTHTLNCQHNVTLTSQVERWKHIFKIFYIFFSLLPSACYLIMKARWWQWNAPILISQHFLPWQHNFQCLLKQSAASVFLSLRAVADCAHISQIQFGYNFSRLSLWKGERDRILVTWSKIGKRLRFLFLYLYKWARSYHVVLDLWLNC